MQSIIVNLEVSYIVINEVPNEENRDINQPLINARMQVRI